MRRRAPRFLVLPVVAALALMSIPAAVASTLPAAARAGDVSASFRSTCTITGTDGNDVLVGTSGDDLICGLAGDDVIRGTGGDDLIYGGPGDDREFGGRGDDNLVGNSGSDDLNGGKGADFLGGGGQASDTYEGGPGLDSTEDRKPLETASMWSISVEPQYNLPTGTKVRWRYTGASDCIQDPQNDVTDTVGRDVGSFHIFTVPTSFVDRCAWVSSSGYWELTITTPAGDVRSGQFFIQTGAPNRLYHYAHAKCIYWNAHCEDASDTELADYGGPVNLKMVIGPI